jgi:hypothetical protein
MELCNQKDSYHDPEFYKDLSPFSAQRALGKPEYQNDPNRERSIATTPSIHPSDVINNNLW